MKGGITSGVVYPAAIVELSKTYRFRSIGGTSAGAIAAACAAAAELGRGRPGAGFDRLAEVPREIAADGRLLSLFQPAPRARGLFRVLCAGLGASAGRMGRILLAALQVKAGAATLGALAGLALVATALCRKPMDFVLVSAGVAISIVGAAGAIVASLVRDLGRALPSQGFGLCSGRTQPGEKRAALTDWLAPLLNEIAGRAPNGPPLTFGDLWGTDLERAIDLQVVTTCLSHGRPYRIPLETGEFYFCESEFRTLFPDSVVDWMRAHHGPAALMQEGFFPLPDPRDLPVVVAARMSLSFPFLISAVPLWAVDYSRTKETDRVLERCWFSDGGISSNFPIHFFDRGIPRRPTFGMNLRPFHPDYPRDPADPSKNIWMPDTNNGGLRETWNRFDSGERNGWAAVFGFLGAIQDTMQSWRDNLQTKVPGFRDRVVHVKLSDDEGGLNLDMKDEVIRALSDRGKAAGALLVTRYTNPNPPNGSVSWPNQRWVRFRTTMGLLHQLLSDLDVAWKDGNPDGTRYMDLVKDPPSYRWRNGVDPQTVHLATEKLFDVLRDLERAGVDLREGAPRPSADLKISPRV